MWRTGLGETLNDLYKLYDKVEDINFGELPDRFVMKTNHACKLLLFDDKVDSMRRRPKEI